MRLENKFIQKTFLLISCLGTAIYLSTCTTPYISPVYGYFFTFSALFFPLVLLGMLFWCCISLLFFRKYLWIFLLCTAAGYKNIQAVFGFHPGNRFTHTKSNNSIRVLSWNVNNFLSDDLSESTAIREMLQFIKTSNADILCFQDFSAVKTSAVDAGIEHIKKITGLPYSFFCEAGKNYGVVIFSRWPFLQQCSIPYSNIGSLESLEYADIQTPSQILRVYNTHLSSMNIHVELMNYNNIRHLKFLNYDTAILLHKDKLSRLAYFDKLHVQQAVLVKKSLDSAKVPFIFTADLNSVPSSFVYHYIRSGLNDAFLEKGFGMGRSYDSLSPTLRIDVCFTSPSVKTIQYHSPRLHLSDHYPIITDIQIKH